MVNDSAGEHHSKHEHPSMLLSTRIKADRSQRTTTAHSTKSRRTRIPLLLLLHPLPLDVFHSVEVYLHPLVDRFPVLQLSTRLVQEGVQQRLGVLALVGENSWFAVAELDVAAEGADHLCQCALLLAAVRGDDGAESVFGCSDAAFVEEVLVESGVLFLLIEAGEGRVVVLLTELGNRSAWDFHLLLLSRRRDSSLALYAVAAG
jgi:hypothetical protein